MDYHRFKRLARTREMHLRIWPDRLTSGRRGPYYDVHIFPTKEQCYQAIMKARKCSRHSLRGTGALFAGSRSIWPRGTKEKKKYGRTKCFGHLYFHAGQFYIGSIVHECIHLGLDYCDRRGINALRSVEEEEKFTKWVDISVTQMINALDQIADKHKIT